MPKSLKTRVTSTTDQPEVTPSPGSQAAPGGLAFALVTRGKGNKTQVKRIEVAAEAALAQRTR
jgi:hypothetical protein